MFNIGQGYTKKDIYKILNVPTPLQKGAWDTGYRKYEGVIYIFCNIGTPGRTGHDYDNHWDGNALVWYAKTRANINQKMIREMLDHSSNIEIFTREHDRDPFTYIGKGTAIHFEDSSPVKLIWQIQ